MPTPKLLSNHTIFILGGKLNQKDGRYNQERKKYKSPLANPIFRRIGISSWAVLQGQTPIDGERQSQNGKLEFNSESIARWRETPSLKHMFTAKSADPFIGFQHSAFGSV